MSQIRNADSLFVPFFFQSCYNVDSVVHNFDAKRPDLMKFDKIIVIL